MKYISFGYQKFSLILGMIFPLFLFSCTSAQLVTKDYKNNGGTVRYLNNGASFIVESRRKDAETKMREYCKGDYRILAESDQQQAGGVVSPGNGALGVVTNYDYTYLTFSCLN